MGHDHLAGKETSLNPLGLVEAMIGAMQHAAVLDAESNPDDEAKLATKLKIMNFTESLRQAMHNTFRYGQGTRDMSGPTGFTTEDFVAKVAWRLNRYLANDEDGPAPVLAEPSREYLRQYNVDTEKLKGMFSKYDTDKSGAINYKEFAEML